MAQDTRTKILFIVQLPPPVHGSAMISKVFVKSPIINTAFNISVIGLHFSKTMSEIGTFSLSKVLKTIGYGIEILRRIRSFRPALVYFTIAPIGLSFYRDIFYVMALKMSKVKIVYHLHVRGIRHESESRIKKFLYQFVFRNTYVITLSKQLENDLISVYDNRPYVVNNGIPVVTNDRALVKSPTSDRVQILYLSNLARSKGVFILLNALLKLHKEGHKFSASIVGKPADVTKEEIEHFILDNDLGQLVVVEDAKYGEEKHTAFMKADIFIHPTLNDAFPLVILEAMQFQLPVVSTFEGAIPEIVDDGRTGFLVAKGDDHELAKKIEYLLLHQQLRHRMGRAARQKFLSKYTAPVMEMNLRSVLEHISQSD